MKSINPHFKQYVDLMDFLGDALGNNIEIVLHDLADFENSIVAIKNNHISGRQLGGPVTDLVLRVMKDIEFKHVNYLTNYKSKSKYGKILHSSTYLIRDEYNKIIGLLCFNIDYTEHYAIKDSVEKLLPSLANEFCSEIKQIQNVSENLNDSVDQLISDSIKQITSIESIEPLRLIQDEKINLIRELHHKGVFLLKGSVVEIASQLQISEATVYRYLSIVKREE